VKPDSTSAIKISRNQVSNGDIIGRDKFVFNSSVAAGRDYLESLYAKFGGEQDPEIEGMIDELQHYTVKLEKDYRNLEQKLAAGDRIDHLDYAEEVKERFAKKLLANENSEVAQSIMASLLARVRCLFQNHIKPLIKKGIAEIAINEAIDQHVIQVLTAELGSNLFKIFADEIYGMVYYLTGNCHIEWDP
jgi:hypothetical protein